VAVSVVYHYVIITSSDMVLERARYGWTTWSVPELKTSSMSVAILSLASTTVAMAKMQEWSANVSSKFNKLI
jgi:hypothetical protein